MPDEPDVGTPQHESASGQGNATYLAETLVAPGVLVSTRFLGFGDREPSTGAKILWETLISGGKRNGYKQHHASRAGALKAHQELVSLAKSVRGESP